MAPMPETWELKITVPANQPANSILTGTIIVDPTVGEMNYYPVPMNDTIYIVDATVDKTPSADGFIVFEKNGKKLAESPKLSQMLSDLNSRVHIVPMKYNGGDIFTIKYINTVAGGASDETITVTLKVLRA